MNCEQVEELLSAYLDDTLALGETFESATSLRLGIAAHLAECIQCSTAVADFRRFDLLISQLPRVSPRPALRDRIFSSPEYLELTGTDTFSITGIDRDETIPHHSVRHRITDHPHLVALPGGRSFPSTKPRIPSSGERPSRDTVLLPTPRKHTTWWLRLMQVTIAAAILFTLGIGGVIGWNYWTQQPATVKTPNGITPPAGLPVHAPLSTGMRYVFLRDGILWSSPADGSTVAQQLTSASVTVAADWVVSPPLPGRSAGDLLAYIDLQRAFVHTVRSDGQRDIVVPQPLLKSGVSPSSVWDTTTGAAILNSLTWSNDASMLAFVGDPTGTGQTNLYILTIATGAVHIVPLPIKGSASHPVWSPDDMRVAFEVTHNGAVSILDYNTQNQGLLVITGNIATLRYPNDTILTLDWSPDADAPTITWSVGMIGHVHSIWQRRVGSGEEASPQAITTGDYAQAIYSRNGHGGIGSWLLLTSLDGRAGNIWRLDITSGALPVALTSGKQVNFARWSPDGASIDYLDTISSGIGTLHIINATTASNLFTATGVAADPAPAWSPNNQQLVYSTGLQTVVVSLQSMQPTAKTQTLKLRGAASAFIWSTTSPHQLVIALTDEQQGVYLIDTQSNTSHQVDQSGIDGPLVWSEVP